MVRFMLLAGVAILFSSLRTNEVVFLRHRLIVLPASTLTINGTTNVNSFACAIRRYCGADTLVIKESPNERPIILKGFVGLEATTFDCGMPPMTSDFNRTLRSDQFPIIGIDFKSFERIPDYTCEQDKFNAQVAISIAGVTNIFAMPCVIETNRGGQIFLKGERVFQFADFKLKPPQRMMGLIKVNEALQVKFNLALKIDVNGW
jgi:hypothetical protein